LKVILSIDMFNLLVDVVFVDFALPGEIIVDAVASD
jgi:hypothetical protein